jgi:hypothetical protein
MIFLMEDNPGLVSIAHASFHRNGIWYVVIVHDLKGQNDKSHNNSDKGKAL